MTRIACDVSSYQPPVDDSYPHRWLIFRDSDPAYASSSPDANAAHNAAWCRAAKAAGRIDGWTTYAVYEPGYNDRIMQYLAALGELDYVMIDVESWGGVITGDHSPEINDLANRLAAKYGQSKIWGYANKGDLASEWPNHVPWIPIVVASYGGTQPQFPNLVGWQYTNGVWQVPGLPNSSPPFGPCDHNQLYLDVSPTPSQPLEDDMYMIAHDKWGTGFWLGNGITRRRIAQVTTEQGYADAVSVLKRAGATVTDLGVVADLDAIGVDVSAAAGAAAVWGQVVKSGSVQQNAAAWLANRPNANLDPAAVDAIATQTAAKVPALDQAQITTAVNQAVAGKQFTGSITLTEQ